MKVAIPLFLALLFSVQTATGQSASTSAPPPADAHIDTVEVTGAKDVDKAVNSFVKSYAKPTPLTGKLARWSTGSPLCPEASGLLPVFNIFVSERIRMVAGMVGAPVETKVPCTPNMVVLFTPHPQEVLDGIVKNHQELLGYHDVSQTKKLAAMSHPIQAWYATATRDDNGVFKMDAPQNPMCETVDIGAALSEFQGGSVNGIDFQNLLQYCGGTASTGNHLNDGVHSEIATVTVIVDSKKIVGMPLGAVSDYITMLALSQTQAFETCQPLASIVNLTAPGCDASLKPSELSQGDTAYLKALYKMNPDVMLAGQQSSIAHQMETALGGR